MARAPLDPGGPASAPARTPAKPLIPTAVNNPYMPTSVTGDSVVSIARQLASLNIPYQWGGTSTSGFDCSGLVQYVMKKLGVNISRTTHTQVNDGTAVSSLATARPGDVLFFSNLDSSDPGVDHTGIYIGNGMMVEAAHTGTNVRVTQLSGYYTSSLSNIRRYMAPGTGANPTDTASILGNSIGLGGHVTTGAGVADMAAQSGWGAAVFNSDPQLAKILREATASDYDVNRIQSEIMATNWFKNNSDSMRKAIVARLSDPATWASRVAQTQATMQTLAGQLGGPLSAQQASVMAEQSLILGWNADQQRQALSHYVTAGKDGNFGGAAGTVQDRLAATAYRNGIHVSTGWYQSYLQQISAGTLTEQDAQNQLRDIAASQFPSHAAQIKAGTDMAEIASPYTQSMSNLLEIPPSSANLFDPTIRKALTSVDAKGQPTVTPLWQFENQLRTDPRYASTNGARDQVSATTNKVLSDMGF